MQEMTRYEQFQKRFHSNTPTNGVCWIDSRLDEIESWLNDSFKFKGEYTVFADYELRNIFCVTNENGIFYLEDSLNELFGESFDVDNADDCIDILSFVLEKDIYIGVSGEYRKCQKLESIYTEKDIPIEDRIAHCDSELKAIDENGVEISAVALNLILEQQKIIRELNGDK